MASQKHQATQQEKRSEGCWGLNALLASCLVGSSLHRNYAPFKTYSGKGERHEIGADNDRALIENLKW